MRQYVFSVKLSDCIGTLRQFQLVLISIRDFYVLFNFEFAEEIEKKIREKCEIFFVTDLQSVYDQGTIYNRCCNWKVKLFTGNFWFR